MEQTLLEQITGEIIYRKLEGRVKVQHMNSCICVYTDHLEANIYDDAEPVKENRYTFTVVPTDINEQGSLKELTVSQLIDLF